MNTPLLASFLLMFYPLVVDSATSKEIKLEKTLKGILDKIYTLGLEGGKGKEIVKFYTENCVLINQGVPAINGKAELLHLYQTVFNKTTIVKKVNVFMDDVYDMGDIVTLRYHATNHLADCSVFTTTRLIIVWKKIKGKYLIHNQVSNERENLCPK
ncbi:uncharacterized protein LOC124437201 isoform X2 [Xenia sp. Carnegie-2017]|uniref:uncharacterized protein LOC124437201 isoform X2 n=1 Tax=Xenia sp. Carnegie-2017 TaxID=2897299 RepID=UPI001F04775B|nr:uncharacterized protein LOC124437201 isoform X2 [Xenia sp. Carnegie-2017]